MEFTLLTKQSCPFACFISIFGYGSFRRKYLRALLIQHHVLSKYSVDEGFTWHHCLIVGSNVSTFEHQHQQVVNLNRQQIPIQPYIALVSKHPY